MDIVYTLVTCIYIMYCIYMAKKYLLYIHRVEFQDEANKSQLVNDLLNKHYDQPFDTGEIAKPLQPVLNKVMKTKADAEKVVEEEFCQGHRLRWNCGKKGCRSGN